MINLRPAPLWTVVEVRTVIGSPIIEPFWEDD